MSINRLSPSLHLAAAIMASAPAGLVAAAELSQAENPLRSLFQAERMVTGGLAPLVRRRPRRQVVGKEAARARDKRRRKARIAARRLKRERA